MSRRILLIDIGSGLTLTGVLPSVALYADYSARLLAGGGTAPYTFTLASGALPAGLYLDAATGIISGSPTEAGNFAITVRVTDLSGSSVVRAFAVQVIAEPLTLSGAAPDGTVGVAQSYTYTVAGGVPPYTFALVDAPAGWSVPDATVPTIDYTPASGGEQSWTLRATDSDATTFDLVDTAMITAPALTLSGNFADATIGTPYSSGLAIAGGNGVYSNPRVTVGSLAGTGLALSIVGSALRLSGTPTGSAQTLDITVAVDSGDGQTASSAQSIALTVLMSPVAFDPNYKLDTSLLQDSNYTLACSISGGDKSSFGASGRSSGKWFFEVEIKSIGSYVSCGIADKINTSGPDGKSGILSKFIGNANGPARMIGLRIQSSNNLDISYFQSSGYRLNSEQHGSATVGDRISCACDFDDGSISFYKNGVLLSTKTIYFQSTYYPAASVNSSADKISLVSGDPLYPIVGYQQWTQ